MVTLLSTAGIPLTVGFYAKYLVLDMLIEKELVFDSNNCNFNDCSRVILLFACNMVYVL